MTPRILLALALTLSAAAPANAAPPNAAPPNAAPPNATPGTDLPTRPLPRRVVLAPPVSVDRELQSALGRWQRATAEALTEGGVTVFEQPCSLGRSLEATELEACAVAHDVPAVVTLRAQRALSTLDRPALGSLYLVWHDRGLDPLTTPHVVTDAPVATQAAQLIQRVLKRVQVATGPWLAVRSTPSGAEVRIDGGELLGRTPMAVRARGETTLQARLGTLSASGVYRAPAARDGVREVQLTLRTTVATPAEAARTITGQGKSNATLPSPNRFSINERWWFWPTVGVVTATTIVATAIALTLRRSSTPDLPLDLTPDPSSTHGLTDQETP